MMKSCKILNVARLLALALVAVLLIPACLPVAHAATATKLALLMEAEKYQYIEGDMFDPEGLVLRVTYDDGTTQNITEGFTFDERPLTLEDEEVKITYEGMTVVQEIQVASAADALIIRFGSGDCIRCYGNGTAIAGGTQMNSGQACRPRGKPRCRILRESRAVPARPAVSARGRADRRR